jgi:hypothetical protein
MVLIFIVLINYAIKFFISLSALNVIEPRNKKNILKKEKISNAYMKIVNLIIYKIIVPIYIALKFFLLKKIKLVIISHKVFYLIIIIK